jgi:hypothetical protein
MRPASFEYDMITPRCTLTGSSRVATWNMLLKPRMPVPGSSSFSFAAFSTSK